MRKRSLKLPRFWRQMKAGTSQVRNFALGVIPIERSHYHNPLPLLTNSERKLESRHRKPIGGTTVSERNKQLVKNLCGAFAARDIPALLAMLDEDVMWRLPGKVPYYSGI